MYMHIEEISLNGWPALQTFLYDGWLLRFSEGYTKRSNSVQPIYGSTLDVRKKVAYCEEMYGKLGQDTVFKITPFVMPPGLDDVLSDRGYRILDHTSVQVTDLAKLREPDEIDIVIKPHISDEWLRAISDMMSLSAVQQDVMRRMFSQSCLNKGFFLLRNNGRPAACGIGVIERGYIGLYDIVTDRMCRRQGFGERMVRHILHWGRTNGAAKGYLLVVKNNAPAVKLYAKLGFEEIYTYWYRSLP